MIKPNLILGDCLEQMAAMPDNSVDSIVTDPPYGLSFMGKKWDYDVPSVEIWRQALRVLKPGGHLLAFAGTRTQHRMAVRIEDAGFEIRDMIAWIYGSGFPKSLDVSKAIDGKLTTGRSDSLALREVNETRPGPATVRATSTNGHHGIVGSANAGPSVKRDEPATEPARQWQGWGTALKPALEPITVARKPLIGTVAANVLAHGTGAINVDGCRVAGKPWTAVAPNSGGRSGGVMGKAAQHPGGEPHGLGRWPANLIHDGSDEVVGLFPTTGPSKAASRGLQHSGRHGGLADIGGNIKEGTDTVRGHDDAGGSAARFFYCAKTSKKDRDEGLSSMPTVTADPYGQHRGRRMEDNDARFDGKPAAQGKNNHPTVKPTALMRYLCRLVTPPGGIVLDPFMGSGSTGKAAVLEGFDFIGIELNPEYFAIAEKRISTE